MPPSLSFPKRNISAYDNAGIYRKLGRPPTVLVPLPLGIG